MHSYEDENFSPINLDKSDTESPQTLSPYATRRAFLTSSDLDDTDESDDEQFTTSVKSNASKSSSSHDIFQKLGKNFVPECNHPDLSSVNSKNSEISSTAYRVLSKYKLIIVVLVFLVAIAAVVISSENTIANRITLDTIKKEFPLQDQDFWIAVETGLQDVITFEKPSVFLFLYKEDDENTTDRILANIATYASCVLNNNCEIKPIILSSEELNNSEVLKHDGGHLLVTYKPNLEAAGVMIIKNLENIPGYVAKILHSFCDEISPVVKKSVFFLTVKVPEFPNENLKYVKSILKERWYEIKEDHFEPLFTRITGMILSINSQ